MFAKSTTNVFEELIVKAPSLLREVLINLSNKLEAGGTITLVPVSDEFTEDDEPAPKVHTTKVYRSGRLTLKVKSKRLRH